MLCTRMFSTFRTLTTLVPPSKAAGTVNEDEWLFILDYFAGLSTSDDFCVLEFHGRGFGRGRVLHEISICSMLSGSTLQKTFSLVIAQKRKYRPRFSTTANDTPLSYTHPSQKKGEKANLPVSWELYPQVAIGERAAAKTGAGNGPPRWHFCCKTSIYMPHEWVGLVGKGSELRQPVFNLFIFICVCKIVGLILVNTATHLHTQCH